MGLRGPKPKPKKPRGPRGRPKAEGVVSYMPWGPGKTKLRFTFSEDVVLRLLKEGGRKPTRNGTIKPYDREFTRIRISLPTNYDAFAVLSVAPVLLESPYPRLRPASDGPRFYLDVMAKKAGVAPGVRTKRLDYEWVEGLGLKVNIPPEDLLPLKDRKAWRAHR